MNHATDNGSPVATSPAHAMGQTVAHRGRNVHRGSNKTGTKSETVGTVFSLRRSSFPRTGDWWWLVHRWGLTGCGPGGGDWLGWLIKRTMGTDRVTVCKYRCNAGDTNSHNLTCNFTDLQSEIERKSLHRFVIIEVARSSWIRYFYSLVVVGNFLVRQKLVPKYFVVNFIFAPPPWKKPQTKIKPTIFNPQ
jgi:hypothetical protein